MLTSLSIRNVVLIRSLDLDMQGGLTALTGETGAGKSILLDAMGLALGQRAESGLVRKNEDQASVTASFELPEGHAALSFLSDLDIPCDDNIVMCRRVVGKDGRSKAYLNDHPVGISTLKDLGANLVDIHGQFETHGLMNARNHRSYLDQYAAHDALLTRVSDAFMQWTKANKALADAQEACQQSRREEQWLRDSLEDIEALAPEIGEEDSLVEKREGVAHREAILNGLYAAHEALEGESGVLTSLGQAARSMAGVSAKMAGRAEDLLTRLDDAQANLTDISADIESLAMDLRDSEDTLENIDDRLQAYRVQTKKHMCSGDELVSLMEELKSKLDQIDNFDDVMRDLQKACDEARKNYIAMAQDLRISRIEAAKRLNDAINAELAPLKLEKARFEVALSEAEEPAWASHGMDQIRFTVQTNPGAGFGALDKTASGGELSRIMLAIKVVLAQSSSVPVLIFDEIDSGVGGSTASAIGERLACLAEAQQVLVVTHSPQVAARAHYHWTVAKSEPKGGLMETSVTALMEAHERREEIARMLAGAEITQEARAAAVKLLETA